MTTEISKPRLLVKLDCADRGCPAVYELDDDTLLVQGYKSFGDFPQDEVPESEALVRVPKSVLRDLAVLLGAER